MESVAQFPQIFAHRGLWRVPEEQNTISAFERAFAEGFGVETDILEIDSRGYISHDTSDYLSKPQTNQLPFLGPVALNIKSDDAWKTLANRVNEIECSNSFFFDGSGPTMFHLSRAGLPFANRVSEFESEGELLAKYLWVDSWSGKFWWDTFDIQSWLSRYRRIILVSPELHKLPYKAFWSELEDLIAKLPQAPISICTDYPEDLKKMLAGLDG